MVVLLHHEGDALSLLFCTLSKIKTATGSLFVLELWWGGVWGWKALW
jgi:hypothetical protein